MVSPAAIAFSAALAARVSALACWVGLMSRTFLRAMVAAAKSLAALVIARTGVMALLSALSSVATKRARASLWIASSAARASVSGLARSP